MTQVFRAVLSIIFLNLVNHTHSFVSPFNCGRTISTSHLFNSNSSHNNNLESGREFNRRTLLSAPVSALATSALLRPIHSSHALDNISEDAVNTVTLSSKYCQLPKTSKQFPLASFGLQVYDDETAYKRMLFALEAGFRNFFVSVLTNNQKGFAEAIRDSGIPRDKLYLCGSVLSNEAQGKAKALTTTLKGCEDSLNAVAFAGIDYLDMVMLDYPGPDAESIIGQWEAFQRFQQDGMVTDLAVSNFRLEQLDTILLNKDTCSFPCVNQIPYSISNHPKGILVDHAARGVLVQSWSPLSTTLPKYGTKLASIGSKYKKSAAQVGLRWIVQNGASFCTQSKSLEHFKDDLNVFDFKLTESEMNQISLLEPPPLLP